jgi:hypothetical protein
LRENFHRSARAPPASHSHAGRIAPPHVTAGHALKHDFAVSLLQHGADRLDTELLPAGIDELD